MSQLAKIRTGKNSRPPRLVVYGMEGIGKSTFANGAPSPIFLPTEDGLGEIAVNATFPVATTLPEFESNIAALAQESHDYQTAVVDTGDWLERLIHEALCEQYHVSNIVKVDGGFGRGYDHAVGHFRRIANGLDYLRNARGMGIIILAHAGSEKVEDPENPTYDRWAPKIHKKAAHFLTEWADGCFFACRKILATKGEDGRTLAAGLGKEHGGDRIMRTVGTPAVTAKNRFGLPAELPFTWQAFVENVQA